MSIVVVGLSHHSAPVEVRERFVFSPDEGLAAASRLTSSGAAREAVLLSTCNRTEFYLRLPEGGAGPEPVIGLFAERAGLTPGEAARYLYAHRDRKGVEHLFRVVTSLDSMILGEAQIQGQVRAAYERAASVPAESRPVGPVLSRLFQMALSVGGRVRSETALGVGAASIPAAAVELAKKVFGSLKGRRALVLGAGEMAELALEALAGEGVRSIVVANRTVDRARELAARAGGRAIHYQALAEELPTTDIVATATSAPHYVLTRELMQRAVPGGPRRPMLIVDIAIPRDVEPEVGGVENVFLYDIDDLRQIVDGNLERRRAEIPIAERIIFESVDEFWSWYASLDAVPLIRELRDRAEAVRRAEVEKALRKLQHLAPEEREAVEQLTRALINKVLHRPTVRLREAASNGHGPAVLHAARYLFELDSTQDDNETGGRGAE
jgi:glutamyl-tRNA reductase